MVNIGVIPIHYDSLRARKARASHHLAHADLYWLAVGAGWAILGGGVGIVVFADVALGWLIAGLAGPFWMLGAWSRELRTLPPEPGASLDGVIDQEILGVLRRDASPQQLADVVLHLQGGKFVVGRFGLGTEFLHSLSSNQPQDSLRVWQEAERLRGQLAIPTITAAVLTVALIRVLPNIDGFLAAAHVDQDDIVAGAAWYTRLDDGLRRHEKKHDGGIGRDWAFGYSPLLQQFGTNISQHIMSRGMLHTELPRK